MRRLNHVHVFGLERLPRFVIGDQDLVQLLSRTNPYVLNLAAGSYCLGEIQKSHAGNLRHKNLTAMHLFQASDYELNALFQSQPEARHTRIRDGDFGGAPQCQKNRNDASAAAYYVAVPGATESCISSASVGIRVHKHFFGAELGRAVEINRIDGFVGAEGENTAHTLIDGRINHVAAAHDVGLNRFKGVVLTSGNLLKGSGVYNYRYASQRALDSFYVSHIPNEITQTGMVKSRSSHLMLLQLVAAEHYQSLRLIVAQHDLDKFFAKRSSPTGY